MNIIIIDDSGRRLKLIEMPQKDNDWFRAKGFRWIKSRNKWSGSCLWFGFKNFKIEESLTCR